MADEPVVPTGVPAPSVAGETPPASPPAASVTPSSDSSPAGGAPSEPPKDGEPPKDSPKDPPAFAADKLTLPEGLKSDDPMLGRYGEIMSNKDLDPQTRGQQLLDLYADVTKQGREAATAAWNDVNTAWQNEVKADAEIGGAKFPVTKATIAKAIDTLGPDLAAGFRQALDVTGAGNNPAIVRGLHAMALKLAEPGHVTGAPAGAAAKPSIKDAFYPNSPDMK